MQDDLEALKSGSTLAISEKVLIHRIYQNESTQMHELVDTILTIFILSCEQMDMKVFYEAHVPIMVLGNIRETLILSDLNDQGRYTTY